MKTLIFLILPLTGLSQFDGSEPEGEVSFNMRAGYNATYRSGTIAAGFDFEAHNIHLLTEMIRPVGAPDKGTMFGLRAGYEIKAGNISIQAGAGRYFDFFTTDAYDKYKNGWYNLFYTSAHYNKWFIQYDYVNGSSFTIGVRETLSHTLR